MANGLASTRKVVRRISTPSASVAPADGGAYGDQEGEGDRGADHALEAQGHPRGVEGQENRDCVEAGPHDQSDATRPFHVRRDVIEEEEEEEQDVGVGRLGGQPHELAGSEAVRPGGVGRPAASADPAPWVVSPDSLSTAPIMRPPSLRGADRGGLRDLWHFGGVWALWDLRIPRPALPGLSPDEAAGLGAHRERTAFGGEPLLDDRTQGVALVPVRSRGSWPTRR